MYPRTEYEMTQADLDKILAACRSTPVMKIGSSFGGDQQENANAAWKELAGRMGFDHMTVQPISGKGVRFFSAVPNENEIQKKERLARDAEASRVAEIDRLEAEIVERQTKLDALRNP